MSHDEFEDDAFSPAAYQAPSAPPSPGPPPAKTAADLLGGRRVLMPLAALGVVAAAIWGFTLLPQHEDQLTESGQRWADRLSYPLISQESASSRSQLLDSCNEAEAWHEQRRDQADLFEDWVLLAPICNQALFDHGWAGARAQLTQLRAADD